MQASGTDSSTRRSWTDLRCFQKRPNSLISFALIAVALLPALAQARDLQGRMGLGYNSQFANTSLLNGVPAVSLKYAFTRDIAIEPVLGVATTSPANSVTALKLYKNLFFETNLNFYFVLGGGIISGSSKSSAQFLSGFGAEFFIPGLESLGLSFETGASFDNTSGSFVFKTMGVTFLNAGMRFYF